jgi:hypothetical protein
MRFEDGSNVFFEGRGGGAVYGWGGQSQQDGNQAGAPEKPTKEQ